jgi:hypothetical protein
MPKKTTSDDRLTLFQIVEEATHLLRRSPISAWLSFYLGTAPFVGYLFFFWSDMSRSASAPQHLLESSLILALLYWWMKVWQALYCERLMDIVEGREEPARMRKRGWLRLVTSQAWIHATMPWVLTLSAIAALPLAWTYAFYHNVTVLAANHYREGGRTKALIGKALAQSHYLPLQNHAMLSLLTLVGLLVFLNIFSGFILFNTLLKSFTGMDNEFTRTFTLYFSSPVLLLLISVCYLIMAPLVKALYVLRCFYGEARRTGADLDVRLRKLRSRQAPALVLLMVALTIGLQTASAAEESSSSGKATADQLRQAMVPGKRNTAPPLTVPPADLDNRIKEVLGESEFQWRFPRDAGPKREESWLGSMISVFTHWLDECMRDLGRWIGTIFDKLFGGKKEFSPSGRDSGWLAALEPITYGLLIIIVSLLAVVLVRTWLQNRKKDEVEVAAEAVPEVNLENDNVLATQLPENEWMRLAREKMQAGELRLALRALFLATLAHLGEKRLIAVNRAKSNGDYVKEVGWRARDRQELSTSFSDQVRTFDRVWYGWHEVNAEMVSRFEQQHEQILAHAS